MSRLLKNHTRRVVRHSGRALASVTRVQQASAAHVAEVRRQIAAGTYLTDEKLDAAVDALLAELRAEPGPKRAAVG